MKDFSEKEIWHAIHELSDIRAGYNIFNEKDVSKYEACSLGIQALKSMLPADKL